MIYLDNAATSWPKPPEVIQAMTDFLRHAGGNPGRSGHRLSIEAGRVVYDAREAIAELFRVSDPLRIIFTRNATQAINTALRGLLRPGDRVVRTEIEHNAVMRPLRAGDEQLWNCAPADDLGRHVRVESPRQSFGLVHADSDTVGFVEEFRP